MQGEERDDRVDRTAVVGIGWPLGIHFWQVLINESLKNLFAKLVEHEDEEE